MFTLYQVCSSYFCLLVIVIALSLRPVFASLSERCSAYKIHCYGESMVKIYDNVQVDVLAK